MTILTRPYAEADRLALVRSGMHPVLARSYAARKIHSAAELETDPARLLSPNQLLHATKAAKLLADAIEGRKRILIVADYDCDGATACAVGIRALRAFGAEVEYLVPNRFELVLLAAQRARNLGRGEELTVERDNDKNPVVALREIADATIPLDKIEADLIKSLSRAPEPEPADEEVLDLIPTDQNIFGLQDISAEEEASALPVEENDMPEDLEAAIEAELAGRRR